MREIKFRAIQAGTNEFIFGLLYFSPGCGSWKIVHSNEWIPTYSNPDEGESNIFTDVKHDTIGQFTGLKDKNGVEIFEKDIIIFKSKLSFFGNLMQDYAELKGLNSINGISYSHSKKHPLRFCYIIENCPFTGIWIKNLHSDYKEPLFTIRKEMLCDLETLEVIGNIHQNKDLLNEQ